MAPGDEDAPERGGPDSPLAETLAETMAATPAPARVGADDTGPHDTSPADGMDATMLADGRAPLDPAVTAAATPTSTSTPTSASLVEGDELPARIGRFLVVRRLGAGGMGVVFACYDETLDRKVAVKLLRPERVAAEPGNSATSTGQARLLREAQALARLSHPNIVAVYEVGTWQRQVFVAMEFVDGEPLSAWQGAAERSVGEILNMYRQAGRGLAAAHGAGLIHRDFKPDNVLVGKDGVARVLDFGLARAAQEHRPRGGNRADDRPDAKAVVVSGSLDTSLTQTGAVMGTPAYMAPEQFEGRAVDARTDQFSFCVSLYEGVYGERPFAGKTFAGLAAAVTQAEIREEPPFAQVPAALRRLLLRGLSSDPNARYPDMDALLADLGRDPGATRRRIAAFGMVAVAVVAAVALGASWWRASGRTAAEQRAQVEAAFDHAADPRSPEVRPLSVDAASLAVQRDELRVSEALAELDADPTDALDQLGRLEVGEVLERELVRWAAAAALARGVAERSWSIGAPAWVALHPEGEILAWSDAGGVHLQRADATAVTAQLPVRAEAGTWSGDALVVVDANGDLSRVDTEGRVRVRQVGVCPPNSAVISGEGLLSCGGAILDVGAWSDGSDGGAAGAEVPRLVTGNADGWLALTRAGDGTRVLGLDTGGGLFELDAEAAPVSFEGAAPEIRRLALDGGRVVGFAGPGGSAEPRAWSLTHRGEGEAPVADASRDGAAVHGDGPAPERGWVLLDADGRAHMVVETPSGAATERTLLEGAPVVEVGALADGRAWTRSAAGQVRVWPVRPDYPVVVVDDLHPKGRLAVSGRVAVYAEHTGRLRAWTLPPELTRSGRVDATERLDLQPFGTAISLVEVDPSGRFVAVGTPAGVKILTLEGGESLFATDLQSGERAQRIAWSNAGDLAVGSCLAGATCGVSIARPEGAPARRLDGASLLTGRLLDLRFSPDGHRVVASDGAGNVAVWRVEDGAVIGAAHTDVDDPSASSAMVLFDASGQARLVRWSTDHLEMSVVAGRSRPQPVWRREGLRALTVSPRDGAALLLDADGMAWAWDLMTDRVVAWKQSKADPWPDSLRLCDRRTRWIVWSAEDVGLWLADLASGERLDLPLGVGADLRCGAGPVVVDDRRLLHVAAPPAEGFAAWVGARLGRG